MLIPAGLGTAADESSPPEIPAACDEFTLRLRGRIDADALWSQQSAKNVADFGALDDVVGLRRARIGVEGEFSTDGSYVAEIDLATGEVVIRDLYVADDCCGLGDARVGHFREPFSLEGGTSARYFAFMERSPINVLDPSRNWGVALLNTNPTEDSTFIVGAFYGARDQNDFEGGAGSTVGVTAKLTAAPINEDDGRKLLHFGVAAAERLPLDDVIIINEKPRSSLLEFDDASTSAFVPKITIQADFQHVLNAQAAIAYESFWTQSEWYGTFIDQPASGAVFYHGCHTDVGYFLTGEHRKYQTGSGVLGTVKVLRPCFSKSGSNFCPPGPGAWEIAARFAWLDFIDGDAPQSSPGTASGVYLPQATFGVNWYLTDQLRVIFNYSYAEPILPVAGESSVGVVAARIAYFW